MELKWLFLPKNHKKRSAAGGFAPRPRLYYAEVAPVAQQPDINNTFLNTKDFNFWFKPPPDSILLCGPKFYLPIYFYQSIYIECETANVLLLI